MIGEVGRSRLVAVVWNLRGLVLLLVGPAVGVFLGAAIFGLPSNLEIIAGVMFVFGFGLCAGLFRAEWRRQERLTRRLPEARFGGRAR